MKSATPALRLRAEGRRMCGGSTSGREEELMEMHIEAREIKALQLQGVSRTTVPHLC